MDGIKSFYCEKYQEFSARKIDLIQKNLIDRIHLYQYTQKKFFFEDNPTASENEFYEWWYHIICNNWQNDIWFMSEEKFQYHWPMITAHFDQYRTERRK